MAVAVAVGLLAFGFVCLTVAVITPEPRGWLRWVLGAFALVFFLLSAGFAFGWIQA